LHDLFILVQLIKKNMKLFHLELWGVVCYQEDGVLKVQRKEMLVPEDDQERCGTTFMYWGKMYSKIYRQLCLSCHFSI
jgi:hypothetical protein